MANPFDGLKKLPSSGPEEGPPDGRFAASHAEAETSGLAGASIILRAAPSVKRKVPKG
jgi:hypothetical protein